VPKKNGERGRTNGEQIKTYKNFPSKIYSPKMVKILTKRNFIDFGSIV